ncbi:hypothetical protein EYC84_007338 [Monilinia fructicola]|uniref:Calcineurin-like phosphoesterase domain-containing protein n=1 Tax=Monilinia fructicola TaxID=38448 RepID=A0A5M9JKF7_MONFR|nr:hypothetical protein EYC84_007338 [Monilinia fructicola]
MTRRIVRTATQLGALALFTIIVVWFLDNRYRVLPSAIHDYMPAHHPGLVITDITVTKCSKINLFTSCKLNSEKWHRIEKDLYLGQGWINSAYMHVQRKKEEELTSEDKVVMDVSVGRLDPATVTKGKGDERWESRPAGLWLKRSAKRHASDSNEAVTSVDVLFGADAVDPRDGWEMTGTPLLLDSSGEGLVTVGMQCQKMVEIVRLILGHWNLLEDFLMKKKPDLIILSGDQINGETAPDAQSAIFKYAELFIKRKIPFATIFGNHDDEGSLPRDQQMALIESLPYSDDALYKEGEWREGVTAPGFNSGFRDALVEQGVVMVSCGHDHANEYCSLSRKEDNTPALWMCYGGGAGFGGYGGYGGYHRRIRLFEIDMNEAKIVTYKRLEYGDIEKRIDEQIIVEGGKPIGPTV